MSLSLTTGARAFLILVLTAVTVVSLRARPIAPAELRRRLPRCVAGLACFGLGIALFVRSTLGLPPWDVLHTGLAEIFDLPVGLVVNLVGLVVLLLWIPLRERPGLGTVLNTLEIGFVLDLSLNLLPTPKLFATRWLFALGGLVIIAAGSGLYIGSGLGPGPRDGVMMGLRRFGLSVRAARTVIELATMAIGFVLGGNVGLGTALFMFGIGPLVQIALRHLSLPPLVDPQSKPDQSGDQTGHQPEASAATRV